MTIIQCYAHTPLMKSLIEGAPSVHIDLIVGVIICLQPLIQTRDKLLDHVAVHHPALRVFICKILNEKKNK